MADNEKIYYQFLNEEGLASMTKGILDKVNVRIAQRIVQELNPGDTTHVPSAAAVLKAINTARHTSIKTVTGDINVIVPLEERSTDVLYLQRDSEEDKTWMMYIWDANPDLHPDPNGKWINVGDTEIDLSGYWSKSDEDMIELANRLGIPVVLNTLEIHGNEINSTKEDINNINSNIDDISADLAKKLYRDEVGGIPTPIVVSILDYADSETDPFAEPAATITELKALIAEAITSHKESVTIKLTSDMNLDTSIEVPAGSNIDIVIPQDVIINVSEVSAFTVLPGAHLTLSGSGTIIKTGKQTTGAITVEEDAEFTINGITIDATTQGKADNYAYGVYAKNRSTINFRSGSIKCAYGSAISTNNTTGGSVINITGGELFSDGSYAIYNAAQSTINIIGGTVQGINCRMGVVNISGEARIIGTTIDESSCDPIGDNISTSGCIWLGDTIAIVTGSYTDPNGNECIVNVSGNATIESSFRAAMGVYLLDTKTSTTVTIDVEDADKVTTSDPEYNSPYKVYDHAYITIDAKAHGKKFSPVGNSSTVITVEGRKIYPEHE